MGLEPRVWADNSRKKAEESGSRAAVSHSSRVPHSPRGWGPRGCSRLGRGYRAGRRVTADPRGSGQPPLSSRPLQPQCPPLPAPHPPTGPSAATPAQETLGSAGVGPSRGEGGPCGGGKPRAGAAPCWGPWEGESVQAGMPPGGSPSAEGNRGSLNSGHHLGLHRQAEPSGGRRVVPGPPPRSGCPVRWASQEGEAHKEAQLVLHAGRDRSPLQRRVFSHTRPLHRFCRGWS